MTVLWVLISAAVISWCLTLVLRRYALAKSLIDIPNERSSHSLPTPRGGGVAIVVSFLLGLPLLTAFNMVTPTLFYGLLGSGLLVAILGFVDDHGHIAARWRLLGHFTAAAWVLYWLNGLPPIELSGVAVDFGWLGNVLGMLYLVWMLNLYNFMDGIDGLASAEAISVCVAICLVYWFTGVIELVWAPLLLAAAVVGFLFWNFPPARIFMGDAGSGFLGLVLGVLALQAAWAESRLFWSWLILLGVFIVDATWTLSRRLIRGDKIYEAHRSHAYQRASRYYKGHRIITVSVVAINVFWLLPLAIWVGVGGSWIIGSIVAYAPICWLAWRLGAGKAESEGGNC